MWVTGIALDFGVTTGYQTGRMTKPLSTPPVDCPWTRVADFINPVTKVWDKDKLRNCVSAEEMKAIVKIPVSVTNAEDSHMEPDKDRRLFSKVRIC